MELTCRKREKEKNGRLALEKHEIKYVINGKFIGNPHIISVCMRVVSSCWLFLSLRLLLLMVWSYNLWGIIITQDRMGRKKRLLSPLFYPSALNGFLLRCRLYYLDRHTHWLHLEHIERKMPHTWRVGCVDWKGWDRMRKRRWWRRGREDERERQEKSICISCFPSRRVVSFLTFLLSPLPS